MTRPVNPPPEWASDETNNTEPSATQKQTGWTPGQDGVSDYDNWWKREANRHLTWLYGRVGAGTLVMYPRTSGRPADSTKPWAAVNGGGVSGANLAWSFDLSLPPGTVIREARAWVSDASGAEYLNFGITEWNTASNTFTSIDTETPLGGSVARHILTMAGIDYEMPDDPDLAVSIGVSPSILGGGTHYLYKIEVDYDEDAP